MDPTSIVEERGGEMILSTDGMTDGHKLGCLSAVICFKSNDSLCGQSLNTWSTHLIRWSFLCHAGIYVDNLHTTLDTHLDKVYKVGQLWTADIHHLSGIVLLSAKTTQNSILTKLEPGLCFFRKKPISSGTPGRKVEEIYLYQISPDKTGRNWTNCERCQKCWKNNYHT